MNQVVKFPMVMIDGESYSAAGSTVCSKGSGDSKEEFTFTLLSAPNGKECWLLTDKGKWYLYQAPPDLSKPYQVETIYEEFKADKVLRNGADQGPCRFAWVGFREPYQDADSPFRGATQALIVGEDAQGDMMLAVPLLQTKSDVYYTPRFPTAKMERDNVTPRSGLGAGPLSSNLGLGLALLFGAAAVLGITGPMKLYWWLGPLAVFLRTFSTRQSGWDHLLRFLGGLFFLHFVTHGLDNAVTYDWEEQAIPLFESAKVAVLSVALWGLRMWSLRAYYVVLDGSLYGGGCSWLFFVAGMVFWCMVQEDNYFQWFTWYSGQLPWSIIWIIAGTWSVWRTFLDYRKVPLDLRGFRSLLFRTVDILDQKLDVCHSKSKQLVDLADDMEDALSISSDPLVCSLADYAGLFTAWQEQAKVLKDIAPEQLSLADKEHLEADLATIAADFRDLIACLDGWPGSRDQLKSLRRSPMLGTWDH